MSETLSPPDLRTPFEAVGGQAGLRRLVDAFYDAMDADPVAAGIRAMHRADLAPIRDRLADWLSGWLGGPPVYAARHRGRPCIMSAHAPYVIGAAEADQWMTYMRKAMDQVELPPGWREILDAAFLRMCDALRNS